MNRTVTALAALTLAAFNLTGCGPAPPPPAASAKIFYPAAPDPPRYQFLFSFSDAAAWASAPKSSFTEFVVGKASSEPLKTKIVNPFGLAARDGKLYVCDIGLRRVHIIDFANKQYSVLGDGKNLVQPLAITIGPDGTRYVCDMSLRQVAVFDAHDNFLRHLGDPAQCAPADVAVYGDELYVADQAGGRIEVWSMTGELKRTISQAGVGPDQLQRPGNVAVGPNGLIYVSDVVGSVVKVFDQQGKLVRLLGEPGDTPGGLARPKGLRIDPVNNLLYVADSHWDTLQVFNLDGQLLIFVREQNELPQGMITPTGIALDPTSVKYLKNYIDPDFQAEYLVFVANEFGKNKIGVYAYGQSKNPMPTTQPQPQPAGAIR